MDSQLDLKDGEGPLKNFGASLEEFETVKKSNLEAFKATKLSGQSRTILDEDVEWLTENFDNVLASIDSDEKLKKDKSKSSRTFNTVADSAKEALIAAFTAQATAEKNLEDSINEAYINAMGTGVPLHENSIQKQVNDFEFGSVTDDDLFEQFNKAVLTDPLDSGSLMKEVESLASIGKDSLKSELSLGKISPKFVENMKGKIEAKQKLAQTLLAELLFAKLVGTMNEQVNALESQIGPADQEFRIRNRNLRVIDQSIYTRLNKLNKLRVSVFQSIPEQSALFLERLNSLNAIYHAKEAQILDKQADDCMSAINRELKSAMIAAKRGGSARADMKAAIATAIQAASTGMAEMMALPEGSIEEDAYKLQYGVDCSDTENFDDIKLRQDVANAKFQSYIDRMTEKLLKLEPPTGDVKKVLDAATIYSKLVGQAVKNPSDPMPADQVMRMKTEMELAIEALIGRCEVPESEATDHNQKQNITLGQAKQAYNRFCEVQGIVSKFALPDGVYDVMVNAGLYINKDGTFNAHLPTNNTVETRSKFQEDLQKAYNLEFGDDTEQITDEFSGDVLSQLSRSYEFSTSRQDWVADPALPCCWYGFRSFRFLR